jgi:Lipid A 3-O-deacylase (PagL)
MVTRVTRLCLCPVAIVASATGLLAQTGTWDVGLDALQSVTSSRPNSVFGGQGVGIAESALSLRASTDLLRLGPIRLRYTAQLLPVIRMSNIEDYGALTTSVSTIYVVTGRSPAYGIGVVPLGLDLDTRLGRRVQIGAGVGAGIAGFSRHVPVAASRQRAFTAEWGTRVRLELDDARALVLGFRWKHTSNGLTAWENPGVDSRMVSAGISWRVRAPR